MAENNALSARGIGPRYIEINGIIGEFFLQNKRVKVRYFSTIASSNDKKAHNLDLLKELKPMRERVKAAELKDLDSLLQRNLNDNRVSTELIPYLISEIPQVAFFTPILSVLIPKDSLNNIGESDYPMPIREDGTSSTNTKIKYGNLWTLEIFKLNEIESNMGILSFDPNLVDLVVLDGQHRSNAFRVVAGAYSEKDSAVYPAFYNQIPVQKDFSADLPVTIIWFEVESPKFDPKIVSRRLFVDVNNTAKKVSRSRTILLEESEIVSAMTRFFYSKVAEDRSFDCQRFSLFHSGFDIDSDITISSENPFSITNPQIFYDILAWLTLGSKRYNNLDSYSVSREAFKNSTISFNEIFRNEEFNSQDIKESDESLDNRKIIISDLDKSAIFKTEYLKQLHNTLITFYDRFNLFSIHFKACKLIDEWYSNGMDSTEMVVWKEIFCGGEGLYYTFQDSTIDVAKREALARFLEAIKSIETRFKKERQGLIAGIDLKELNSSFESASSKAFQIGIFMALDIYRSGAPFEECYEDFFTKLNNLDEKKWIYILTVLRRKFMPAGVSPKSWPAYQKLILRLIQDEQRTYYSDANFRSSPDGVLFENNITALFDIWYQSNDQVDLENLSILSVSNNIEAWSNKAKIEVDELLSPIGKQIIKADYQKVSKEILEMLVAKITG